MGFFTKLSIVIWVLLLIIAAIMFDWFGSREVAFTLADWLMRSIESLSQTGDDVQDAIEHVRDGSDSMQQGADEAYDVSKEKFE